jgi:hypothetical protein
MAGVEVEEEAGVDFLLETAVLAADDDPHASFVVDMLMLHL